LGYAEIARHLRDDGLERLLMPLPPYLEFRLVSDRRLGDGDREIAQLREVVAVVAEDHVALLHARLLGWRVLGHLSDERAFGFGRPTAVGVPGRHLRPLSAAPAALALAVLLQLLDDGLGEARGNGEADADRAAVGRVNGGVDADHMAVQVEGGPAGVAAVDGGV